MKKNAILVLNYLKTKPGTKALGFNKEELEGVAADIADNLALAEDASEEDVQQAVESAVNNALPYLIIAQKTANRIVESKKKTTVNEPGQEPKNEPGSEQSQTTNSDEVPKWAMQLIDGYKTLSEKLEKVQGERVTDSRRKVLEDMLKGTGAFGQTILKSFDKMKFETDEEFDEYKSDVGADLAALNQERANAGLEKLGISVAPNARQNEHEEKAEVISDAALDELANQL